MRARKVPFQITGGFAARVYGSKRRLADIDIEIPERHFKKILKSIQPHVLFGLKRYRDHEFDVLIITLRYKGQVIDITGSETVKIFDKRRGRWISGKVDLSSATRKVVFGVRTPLVRKGDLIRYKKILGRRVDKADIQAISK